MERRSSQESDNNNNNNCNNPNVLWYHPKRWTNNRARIKEKRTRSDFKASVFGILLIWEMLKIYVFECICTQTFLAKDDMIRERAQNGWNSLWNSILHHISFERPFRDGFEWGVEPARSEPTTCEIVLQRNDTHRNEKTDKKGEKSQAERYKWMKFITCKFYRTK